MPTDPSVTFATTPAPRSLNARRRSSMIKGRMIMTTAETYISAYKDAIETESIALATSLSPGTALTAIMNLPPTQTPRLKSLVNEISVASIPMPLSHDALIAYERSIQMPLSGLKHRQSILPTAVLGQAIEESTCTNGNDRILVNDQDYESASDDLSVEDTPAIEKKVTLWDKIKNAKAKVPVQKRILVQENIFEEKEKELERKKAIAIVNLLETRRAEYHEQARKEIQRHLDRSRMRLSHLEKTLKIAESQKEKEREEKKKKRIELPEYLVSGAQNNFPVPQKYKNSWYDRVAMNYQLRRGIHTKNEPKEKLQGLDSENTESQKTKQTTSRKRFNKKSPIHEMSSLDQMAKAIRGLPEMQSLVTDIGLSEESLYFYDYLNQKQNPGKNEQAISRKLEIKRMSEQLVRNKHSTMEMLTKKGIQTLSPVEKKEMDENQQINISDDEEMLEVDQEGKVIQRRKPVVSSGKKASTDQIDGAKVYVDNEGTPRKSPSILVSADARRSFVAKKSRSGITGEEIPKIYRLESMREEDASDGHSGNSGCTSRSGSFQEFEKRSSRAGSYYSASSSPTVSRMVSSKSFNNAKDTAENMLLSPLIARNNSSKKEKNLDEGSSWIPNELISDHLGKENVILADSDEGLSETISPVEPEMENISPELDQQAPVTIEKVMVKYKEREIVALTWDEMLQEPIIKIKEPERVPASLWRNPLV